jgi:hypothetical protein
MSKIFQTLETGNRILAVRRLEEKIITLNEAEVRALFTGNTIFNNGIWIKGCRII